MGQTHDGDAAAMDKTERLTEHPATSNEMTAALNAALEAGDLNSIMGIMGQMARAHRMRRVARETGLGEKSLYKSMRAGASPEFNTVLRVLRSLGFRLQAVPLSSNDSQ
ncbi:MAG: putative addiction module antidote protein [Chloroflexota bacterium]|nr:putative addiction module antidote protein [Chloroflexota bacterium]